MQGGGKGKLEKKRKVDEGGEKRRGSVWLKEGEEGEREETGRRRSWEDRRKMEKKRKRKELAR